MSSVGHDILLSLVCPICHGFLRVQGTYYVCEREQLAFPIKSGIPVLIAAEAVPLSESALSAGVCD